MSNALCASVINDVQFELRLSQERFDGELNLSQEQIDELMAPMENMSNTQTISVDVHPEPQKQVVQTLPNTTCMPNVTVS